MLEPDSQSYILNTPDFEDVPFDAYRDQPPSPPTIPTNSSAKLWERIHDGLNPAQRRAVDLREGPVLVVAGAGSGKTRVLTRRIAGHIADGVPPEAILAITFTNKAAAEMRVRVAELVGSAALDRMWVSTFHSACVRMLRMRGPLRWFSILDASDSQKLVRAVMEDLGYEKETLAGGFVRNVAGHISRAKNNLAVPRGDGSGGVADTAARVYAGYQQALRRMKAYDFDDLLVETVRMLREDPDTLAYFQSKFSYVLVDEYQDTNRAQYAILRLLAANHQNICVVGDIAQGIYSFRGATVENIRRFEKDWPAAQTVILDQNYRSTKKILEVANVIRAGMDESSRTELWTEGKEGETPRLYVAVDDRDEAQFVCRRVREQGRPGDHAVLYRTNAQSRPFEEALMRANIPYKIVGGTRFYDRAEVKDALAYLRFCVNPTDLMAFNRIVNTPRRGLGEAGMAKIIQVAEERGVDLLEAARIATDREVSGRAASAVARFVAFCDKVIEAIETEGPAAGLEVVLLGVDGSRREFRSRIAGGMAPEKAMLEAMGQTGQGAMYSKFGDEKEAERLQNLFELGRAAAEFEAGTAPATLAEGGSLIDLTPRQRTEAYLEHVTLVSDLDEAFEGADGSEGAVLLMTIHAAKGLEFPHVTVVGWEDGLLPLRFGRKRPSREEEAEERRLAYVAVTRAEETLCLTRAQRRMVYGEIRMNDESVFLTEIKAAVSLDVTESGPSVSGAQRHNWGQDNLRSGSWGSQNNWSRRGGGRYREYWPNNQRRTDRPHRANRAAAPKKTGSVGDWKFSDPEPSSEERHLKEIPEGIAPGTVIEHPAFGRGVVTQTEGEGDGLLVKARFEKGGEKALLAKFAGLRVVGQA